MKFEKVSLNQYLEDAKSDEYFSGGNKYHIDSISQGGHVTFEDSFETLKEHNLSEVYDMIKLPTRATKKSAGYDIYAPYDFKLSPGDTIKIATGIRVLLDDDKFLMCAPRSGHGFKARIQLDNTVGIIDADYSDSKNEGHIMLKLTNDSHTGKTIYVKQGDGMAQGIILSYHTVEDDNSDQLRDGGFGSTDNNN